MPVKIKKNPTIIGKEVVAIGSPFGYEYSISKGIISAIRQQGTMIQTDAAINGGNSGGPLIEKSGCVVGMNTAGIGETNTGLGFAISNKVLNRFVKKFLPDYILVNDQIAYKDAIKEGLPKNKIHIAGNYSVNLTSGAISNNVYSLPTSNVTLTSGNLLNLTNQNTIFFKITTVNRRANFTSDLI